MLFSSIPFIYYFLPIVLLFYFIVLKRGKNLTLLLSSLVFYAWGEPRYVVLMAVSILSGYFLGLLIERSLSRAVTADLSGKPGSVTGASGATQEKASSTAGASGTTQEKVGSTAAASRPWQARFWLVLSCVISLALLGFFKYADFFIGNFNSLTGLGLPFLKIALPIGISFYTFQILSYTIDVYRGNTPAQKNLISFATYVVLFPQLIAGPIIRYVDIAKQLDVRSSTFEKISLGTRRFIIGLSKKILLANSFGALCDVYLAGDAPSVLFTWMYAIAFSLQIYFDFSGYSDMAIGLSKIFGFDFPENFNYPYISASITEFWRRWHISLGSWFRDYVYIPLGGNRVSTIKWLRNILVVWMLTGFWHGAAWNFVLWGLFFAIFLVVEKFWLLPLFERTKASKSVTSNSKTPGTSYGNNGKVSVSAIVGKIIRHVYVLFAVMISFVLFNASSVAEAVKEIGGLFGAGGLSLGSQVSVYYLTSYAVTFLIGFIACTPFPKWCAGKLSSLSPISAKILRIAEPVVLCLLLLLCTANLVDGSFNPFLYFRF